MRSIASVAVIAVAMHIAGCQIVPYDQSARFTTWSDADLYVRPVHFPIVATFPDNTMFFYPIYDNPPRADLVLRGISCRVDDGRLAVLARVQNMGSDIIASVPLLSGDLGAFRIAATVTTVNGAKEEVGTYQIVPLTVSSTVVVALNSTAVQASDVTRIDVVADPDRIVPDPIRDNNTLTWQGRIDPSSPDCRVDR